MGGIFHALFGGGQKTGGDHKAANAAAAASTAGPTGVAPGTSPDEYKRQQQAQYQQMLAGLGLGGPGGELPQGIQENIDRQASLLK